MPVSEPWNAIYDSLNIILDALLNGTSTDLETDIQKVPIDRVSDTNKLSVLLMSYWGRFSTSNFNYFSCALSHVSNHVLLIDILAFREFSYKWW